MIKPLTRSTARPGTDGEIGGFGGLFDLKAAGFHDPILVAATDGVGTKLKVAIEMQQHHTVGIDLVAMCVNDLISQGATPLFFLDYYATAKLSLSIANNVVEGIAEGCRAAGCALIGGETAEMPGMYHGSDYDLAGFAVGAVERTNLLTLDKANEGDILLGLNSNGLHSNGFSMIRRLLQDLGISYHQSCSFSPNQKFGEALITPTRIYVNSCLKALKVGGVTGLAHITGGGLIENPPRAYKDSLTAKIDATSWPLHPVFKWLLGTGKISTTELASTFNCGIGMVVIVRSDSAQAVSATLRSCGETVYKIGVLENRTQDMPNVIIENIESWMN
tara:strand:- start:304 stop:1302 length:999 start_codon:yes stop_codon:yes gene_type:complete